MTNGSKIESLRLAFSEADALECYERRRLKAAFSLALIWLSVVTLHLLAWGQWIIYGLTLAISLYFARLLRSHPTGLPSPLPSWQDQTPIAEAKLDTAAWPCVSILVAAKNEVTVIRQLAEALTSIDYPSQRYDVWIVDDNSTDGTAEVLDCLAGDIGNLHVVHRGPGATGGKSGALNQVWRKTRGSLLVVFDADAQIAPDCLRRIVPLFNEPTVGAVQMRKAIANDKENFWTQGQVAEMAFDAYCQLKRVASRGIGELRGNGQFVRRVALEHCGGWNEETITDDLDLTFRLHLIGWDIPLVMFPAVHEEGVTRAIALWHQRNRWAEGGYQRYLDYWRLLTPKRLGWNKAFDLFAFWIVQYILPAAALPDIALSLVRNRLPVLMPLSSLVLLFSTVGMANGLWRTQRRSSWIVVLQTMRGMLYMMHWFVVIAVVILRMAIRPKRLKWVKTQHSGLAGESVLEATISSQ